MMAESAIGRQLTRGVDYELQVHNVPAGASADNDEVIALMGRVGPIHDQVLNLAKPRTYGEVIRNVMRATEVVFAVTKEEEPRDIGVIVQAVKTIQLAGQSFKAVMVFMRAIYPEYQGSGVGTELSRDAIERHDPDAISGRTPNPNIFRMYEKIEEIGKIRPIHGLFTPEQQIYLAILLPPKELETTDLRTGRCIGVYPRGAQRLVTYDENDIRMKRTLQIMTGPKIGANLEEGDGVRYIAEIENGPKARAKVRLG